MVSSAEYEKTLDLARMVVARLEKLSVDSIWARRASGARRELVRLIDLCDQNRSQPVIEPDQTAAYLEQLEQSMRWGFEMLENAAHEIPDLDEIRKRLSP